MIQVRQKHPYWEGHRGILPAWVQANAAKKDLAKRITWAKTQLAASDKSPVFKEWLALENAQRQNNVGQVLAIRRALLAPNRVKDLPDALAGALFNDQQHYLRHYAGRPRTPKA